MNCPKCASAHTMSTTKKESVMVKWMVAGRDYAKSERQEVAVVHKCLDCGNEWDGQEENQGSSQAVGNISQYQGEAEEPEEEV